MAVKVSFSYKIVNGLLYFNFNEVLRNVYSIIGRNKRKKFELMFQKVRYMGEAVFILFFREEAIQILENGLLDKKNLQHRKKDVIKLREFIELLKSVEYEKIDYTLNMDKIQKDMKYPPLKHQEDIYEKYEEMKQYAHNRGMLLDAAPGTGKTYMSLSLTRGMDIDNVIIIAPLATLENVWVSSLTGSKCLFNKEIKPYMLAETDGLENINTKEINYYIVNYEKIDLIVKKMNALNFSKRTCFILDESHNFGDPKSNRSRELLNAVKKVNPQNVLLLSGTPVKAKMREIIVIRALLDNEFFEYENKFYKIYSRASGVYANILSDDYKDTSINITKESMKLTNIFYKKIRVNLGNVGKQYTLNAIGEELRKYTNSRLNELNRNMSRYKNIHMDYVNSSKNIREDVKKRYLRETEKISMMRVSDKFKNKELLSELKNIEAEISKGLSKNDKDEFLELCTIIKFLELKVRGEALGKIFLKRKIECYTDIIRKMKFKEIIDSAVKKTVIFSSFIENCEEVYKKVVNEHFEPVCVYGNHTKNLNKNVESFNDIENEINPLIATYSSLSTGVELTTANAMILIDLPYRAAELEQTIARIWRHGQDEDCYIYLVELDTGEEKNINQRTVDIVRYYDNFVMQMTGHGSYQDLSVLNYDGEKVDIKFESDMANRINLISSCKYKVNYNENRRLKTFLGAKL